MPSLWTLAAALTGALVAAQEYKFKNPQTTPHLVDSLPEVDFSFGELYGGSVPINESDPSRNLFYLFKPKHGEPSKDIVIWIDGRCFGPYRPPCVRID